MDQALLCKPDDLDVKASYKRYMKESVVDPKPKEEPKVQEPTKINSDGGPSDYYDFPGDWTTLNDFIEYKCKYQWLGPESFHWGNVIKALCRWGDKGGTTKEYDTKKVIYSGARVLKATSGVSDTRDYLKKLLDDPQFQEKEDL